MSKGYQPTPFVEANALLCIQSEDREGMDEALAQLDEEQLLALAQACERLQLGIRCQRRARFGSGISQPQTQDN
jgi:hypothetical protein